MDNTNKKLRRIILSFIISVIFLLPGFADQSQKVKSFINSTAKQVITVIDSKETDAQKEQRLRDIFCNTVDINWMGKFVLGKYYRKIGKGQLRDYLSAYKAFLINTYVSKFSEYNGVRLDIDFIKPISNSQYIVNTKVLNGKYNSKYNSKYINVAYRIAIVNNQILIRDIIAEDISLILGQRSDFNSIISKEGIISLIQKLKNKVT